MMLAAEKRLFLFLTALFPIVDPLGGSPIFLAMTKEYSPNTRRELSWRIAMDSFFLLVGSHFIGTHILAFFGISMERHPRAFGAGALTRQTCMKLSEYRKKRNFDATPEPRGAGSASKKDNGSLIYTAQKHMASQLHYDFRLEWRGVLLSWAVPKGPSLDPSVKRLAIRTEDHPAEYADFEGVIPAGQYGAGTVMLWDRGTWQPESADVDASLQAGEIKFTLYGKKLRGSWVLVHTRGFGSNPARSAWLLIKHRDQYASTGDVTQEEPRSVASQRLLAEIARDGGGDVERASMADPAGKGRPTASANPAPGRMGRRKRTL
ncbi:MAG TPA: MarC family protein [Terriglobia bacterium]|nr:MarC family protein [Terriglobia bacterium]